jgi:hypothetical protein
MPKSNKSRPTDTGRKALHAYLSDEAHAGWHEYAAAMGVSVSGLLEALIQTGTISSEEFPDDSELVHEVRRIDAERRRRNR